MMQQLLHINNLKAANLPLTEEEWSSLYHDPDPNGSRNGIFKQYRISVKSKGISVIVPIIENIGIWNDGTGRMVCFLDYESPQKYEVNLYPDGIAGFLKTMGSTPEGTYRNNNGLIATVTQVEHL